MGKVIQACPRKLVKYIFIYGRHAYLHQQSLVVVVVAAAAVAAAVADESNRECLILRVTLNRPVCCTSWSVVGH